MVILDLAISKRISLLGCLVPLQNESNAYLFGGVRFCDDDEFLTKWYSCLHVVLGFVTILGNSFVISYVHNGMKPSQRHLHQHTKASLAVNDLVLGCLLIYTGITDALLPCEPPPPFYVDEYLLRSRFNMFTTVGVCHLCAMSIFMYSNHSDVFFGRG